MEPPSYRLCTSLYKCGSSGCQVFRLFSCAHSLVSWIPLRTLENFKCGTINLDKSFVLGSIVKEWEIFVQAFCKLVAPFSPYKSNILYSEMIPNHAAEQTKKHSTSSVELDHVLTQISIF